MNNVINEIINLYMATDEDTRKQIRDVLVYLENLNAIKK
mgnify:CR=1 FL=1